MLLVVLIPCFSKALDMSDSETISDPYQAEHVDGYEPVGAESMGDKDNLFGNHAGGAILTMTPENQIEEVPQDRSQDVPEKHLPDIAPAA